MNKITQGQQVMLINVYDSRIYGAVKSDWENLKEALSHYFESVSLTCKFKRDFT